MYLAVLFSLCVVVPTYGYPEDSYKNGFYSGRSADIIIDDVSPAAELQLQWQLTKKTATVTHLNDVNVLNLVSRALGLPQLALPSSHQLSSHLDDTVPFNFFSSTTGNMFFSIAGLTSGKLPSSYQTLGRNPIYTINHSSRPYHPLSLVSTVTSGTVPRRHGVVNERNTLSTTLNLHDLARGMDSSAVVVGSGCKHFAQVLASHDGSDSLFWDPEINVFRSVNTSTSAVSAVLVNESNIGDYLSSLGYFYQPGVEGRLGEVAFDIHDDVDNTLFAELAFVTAWSNYLRSVESRKFFAFHFTSLTKLASKYGQDSAQWKAALLAIDEVITRSHLDDCAMEILYLPTYRTPRYEAMRQLITPVVAEYVSDNIFPQLYLNEGGLSEQAIVCDKIRHILSTNYADVTVFCPLRNHEKRAIEEDQPVVETDNSAVLAFHYVFWTHLVLIAIFLWAAYAIAYIPPDESLYTASTYYKKGPKAL